MPQKKTAFETFCIQNELQEKMLRNYVTQQPLLDAGTKRVGQKKSKLIPSIFNDESTESFICLMRHIYMSHVNKVQPIHVKMICIAAIRVTRM
jgi:hypothetical protein